MPSADWRTLLVMVLLLGSCSSEQPVLVRRRDEALVKQVHRLCDQARFGVAREAVLQLQPRGQDGHALQVLSGKIAVEPGQWEQTRQWVVFVAESLKQAQHWQAPPPCQAVRVGEPVRVDGNLDEAAWSQAPVVHIDVPFDQQPPEAGESAQCRFLWDSQYLYVGFHVRDAHIIAPLLERDGPVYESDCVELFVLPDIAAGVYWELNVSPSGSIFDTRVTKAMDLPYGAKDNTAHITGLHTAINTGSHTTFNTPPHTTKNSEYAVEIAIPWSSLPGNVRPGPGVSLRVLAAWSNRSDTAPTAGTRYFSHTRTFGGYTGIWSYGTLELLP